MTAAGARGRRVSVALLATGLLVLAGVFVAIRVSLPADGTITGARTSLPDGVEVDVLVGGTGLHSGDEVISVDGRPLATRSLPDAEVGDELAYGVRRGSNRLEVDVPVRRYPVEAAVARNWSALALLVSIVVVAAYVFARRPDDRGAQVLLIVAALLASGSTASVFGLQVLDLGGGPGWWANLFGGVAYIFVWPAMLHFALVFATPRPIVDRHRWVVPALYVAPVALYLLHVAIDRPQATTPLQQAGALVPSGTPVELIFLPCILAALVVAYRTADQDMRRRLRWVGGAFVFAIGLYLALWRIPLLVGGEPLVPQRWHLLLLVPCPVAIGFAVLRLQLFEIDVVIRRSLVYASLTACVVGLYGATVGLLSRLVPGDRGWVALVATGIVAVLFAPLHRRLQRVVSRLFYGERDDPYAIVARLGQRLEATPAPSEVLPVLVTTVAEALRLPYAAIEVVRVDGPEEAARYGRPAGETLTLPLAYQGEVTGNLVVGERSPGDGFGRRDRRALDGLAAQLGMAVRAARLSLDLQRSREQLVAAREEERRRIRRDLHDGLGPALAATALEVQVARALVRQDVDATEAKLTQLQGHLKGAIADVRGIVEGLRPASLDELGLVGAIEEQASRFSAGGAALHVAVETEGDLRCLPAAVEVAAFRIVCEAVHNAHRHGGAHGCTIRLTRNGALEVEVADDGSGRAEARAGGVGLESMRERAAELGGSFGVESPTTGGTRVWARLPLPPG